MCFHAAVAHNNAMGSIEARTIDHAGVKKGSAPHVPLAFKLVGTYFGGKKNLYDPPQS